MELGIWNTIVIQIKKYKREEQIGFLINVYVLIICLQMARNIEIWIMLYEKLDAFLAYIQLHLSGA